jgi:hypothetical protein
MFLAHEFNPFVSIRGLAGIVLRLSMAQSFRGPPWHRPSRIHYSQWSLGFDAGQGDSLQKVALGEEENYDDG